MVFLLVVRLRQKSFQVFLEVRECPSYWQHFPFGLSQKLLGSCDWLHFCFLFFSLIFLPINLSPLGPHEPKVSTAMGNKDIVCQITTKVRTVCQKYVCTNKNRSCKKRLQNFRPNYQHHVQQCSESLIHDISKKN